MKSPYEIKKYQLMRKLRKMRIRVPEDSRLSGEICYSSFETEYACRKISAGIDYLCKKNINWPEAILTKRTLVLQRGVLTIIIDLLNPKDFEEEQELGLDDLRLERFGFSNEPSASPKIGVRKLKLLSLLWIESALFFEKEFSLSTLQKESATC